MTNNSDQAREGNPLQRLWGWFATSLRVRFGLTTALMAVLPMIIVVGVLGVLVIDRTTATLKDEIFARLESIRTVKANAIADYFAGRRSDMAALVATADTLRQEAFDQLLAVQTIKQGQIQDYLQTTFNMVRALKDNLSTAQAIAEFAQAIEAAGGTGGPQWTAAEKEFGFTFETAKDDFGFYDLFLIAEDGRVVYSVIKELGLGANVLTGDLKDSGLGRAFRGALGQEIAVEDFTPFGDLPAAFVAGPVLDAGGELVGVLAVQLSTRGINAIMTERTGLGESGETYLVGPDKLFRSDSRFVDESTVLNPAYVVDTLAVDEALSGNSGQEIVLDYRGVHVLSAYAPLEIAGLQWAILAEIDLAEALAPRVEGAEKDFFTQYKESYGYYDLFLISPDGYIFYTVEHEPDYQTNILTGPYKDSNLGALVKQVLQTRHGVEVADFAPSRDAVAAYFAAPVTHEGEVELIVAAQISLDQIDAIMQERTGLGDTGETYLVGPDKLMRSDSRFLDQLGVDSTVLNAEWPVDTVAARSALAGEAGTQIIEDYRGLRVLSSWSPLVIDEPDEMHLQGITWAVIAEIDESEALEPSNTLQRVILGLAVSALVVASVVAALIGVWIAIRLVRPILGLTQGVLAFAGGDLDVTLSSTRRDEVGVLTNTFGEMAARIRHMILDVRQRSVELAERTRELEASQGVTFAASERATPDELLGLVVDLVRDQFDLYHAQVYLVDEERNAAVLRQSTGYAGSQLLQRGHHIPLDRTALVTKAIHENQPMLVADVSQDPDFLSNPLLPETRSELVVPLRIGERVLGALDVQDRVPGRFSESTVALFQAMTDQVAFLFENNELLEHVAEQTESLTAFTIQLRTAADIAEQLSTILDPEQMLHEMVELLQSYFGLYHAHVYVLDETTRQLTVRAGSGEVGRVLRERGHSIPLDREKSLVARAARTRQPVLIADTTVESDFLPNPLLPQTRSELSVPLVAGERVLGVLDLQDDQPGRFVEIDVDTFTTLASQVAASLQNAALFEQTQARLRVGQALAGAESEEQVLDAMIGVADFYPRAQVSIFTFDQEPETGERASVARRVEAFDSGIVSFQPGMRLPASQFTIIEYVSLDTPFVTSNVNLDERVDPATRELTNQLGTVSLAILPITAGQEWIGLVAAASKEEGYFDERKLYLYHALAEQGATALHTARLRDELRESVARFAGFSEATDYGFSIADLEGNIIFVNPAFCRMLGEESPEAMLGKKIRRYYPPELVVTLTNEVFPILMEQGQWVGELELLTVDGRRIPVEENYFVIRDASGAPRYVADILTDITERVQAEAERERFTTQLGTASVIATQISSILDPDRLLNTVIPLLKERFNLYYAHFYTLDQGARELVLSAGYGEPGRIMLERGHKIPLDQEVSLVARAARTKKAVVVHDVTEAPDFWPNPLLPDTRSEVAVPAVVAGEVLGVFDVQHDEPYYFTEGDLSVFNTLAGQIATALNNAALFEQTQARLRVGQALAGAESEEQVLDAMIRVADFYPQAQVSIFTFDQEPETGERASVARRVEAFDSGIVSFQPGMRLPASQFTIIEYVSLDTSFVTPNVNLDERVDPATRELTNQLGTVSLAILPITAGQEWIGLVAAASKEEGYFDERKLYLYHALAEQGATALRTARLFKEQQQAQEALRESEKRLRTILGTLPIPIVVSRASDGVAMYLNASLGEMIGLPVGELIGRQTPDFYYDPADRQVILETLQKEGHLRSYELRLKRADGTPFWGLISIQPTLFEGELVLVSGIIDVTARVQAQEELRRLGGDVEQSANVRQSEFLAGMSHDLRTPLNSIIGYAELMLMGIDGELAPETLEDAQAIYDNGQRLLHMLNVILDLAKIEAGHLALNLQELQIESLIDAARSSASGLLTNKPDVKLVVEVEDGLPAVQGDAARLDQVLNNLISNAVKFTDQGYVSLRAFGDDDRVCVEVKDTGIGIAASDLDKIFDRFQQVDSAAARRAQGIGLGLPITRDLVQLHGGTIDVQSEPGQGSTFTVWLPVKREE